MPNLERPSQHSFTSAGEVTSSFPSQNHEHDGCFGPPSLFFSLSVAFSRVASSTSPLSSDLSSSYLPSTAPSLATASFSSMARLLAAQTSPSVSLSVSLSVSVGLNRFGNLTEISGQNQNYIWKPSEVCHVSAMLRVGSCSRRIFTEACLLFSSIRGLKNDKCRLAVSTHHSVRSSRSLEESRFHFISI